MKVVHVPYSYFPDPPGGTEVYVDTICREMLQRQMEPIVAAPGKVTRSYVHNDVPVHRFETSTDPDLAAIYEYSDERAAEAFGETLERERPDVVHLHALTSAVSPLLVQESHQRSIPVVFSYHTPTVTCQRGTLLRWGSKICDGKMRGRTCTACTLNGLGAPRSLGYVLGATPQAISKLADRLRSGSRPKTALRMRDLIERRHRATRRFIEEVDHLIAMSEWALQVLLINGADAEKVTTSRHCVDPGYLATQSRRPESTDGLRLVWFGRCQPSKGLQLLVEAVAQASNNVFLDVYPIVQADDEGEYLDEIRAKVTNSERVRFRQPVPPIEVVSVMPRYDAVAVPSLTLETGPLVLLQALAAGVPVIGTSVPAISELIEDGRNGFLIESADARQWAKSLDDLASDPGMLQGLAVDLAGPQTPSGAVAGLTAIYERVLESFEKLPTAS